VKKKKWLARRRELYSWHRRAAVVGIATLPPKKVSKGTRLAWEESIIQAEGGCRFICWGGYTPQKLI